MTHKVTKECLSCRKFKKRLNTEKFAAFSLAEMLCVLLIMSFIAIGVPMVQFKKTELKTKRSLHGRYECYYDGNQLMQYTVNEEGAATGPSAVSGCTFTPPSNAIFFLVHAVGGGGGASSSGGGGGCSSTTTTNKTYYVNQANDFPQWLRNVQGAGQLPTGVTEYNTQVTGCLANITYGNGGKSGSTVSMFFPRLNNVVITMSLGRGGALGAAGGTTTVSFDGNEIIRAPGGDGGSGGGSQSFWVDSADAMCNITDNSGIIPDDADFSTSIEMDFGTKMHSMMAEACAGNGGSGAYGSASGTTTYYVNGVDVTAYVKKTACEIKQKCTATAAGASSAQAGRSGAVVILW